MSAKPIKILFFGDVVGKIGRRAVAQILPEWQKKYKPDLIMANVENLAHGKGITEKTLNELKSAGVNIFTGGNHIWSKDDPASELIQTNFVLALPANDPQTPASVRWQTIPIGEQELYLVSLLGQFQMEGENIRNPFHEFDELYQELKQPKLLLVDFHAEATSEKVAFGLYLAGRASAVLGTHTHVPTADARVLNEKTGYISDLGMVGGRNTVLGVKADIIINRFKQEATTSFDWPDDGPADINAALIELDPTTGYCLRLEPIHATITIR